MLENTLPAANATLNAVATVLLFRGLAQVRRGDTEGHRKTMIAAVSVSALFLVLYLCHHGLNGSKQFVGPDFARYIYYAILAPHIVLAAVNLPMILVTFARALKGNFEGHRRIAKLTWGIWVFVSISGVVVYLMVYQLWPDGQFIKPGEAVAHAAEAPMVRSLDASPSAIAPNNKASIRHLARGKNAYLGLLKMEAGAAVPVHRDATEEYIHILKGSGEITIDGQSYPVTAGTTVYMPKNAEVRFQNGKAPLEAIQVFAGPGPSQKYQRWTPTPK